MGNVFLSIPKELALRLKDAHGLDTLIETGTYKCGTSSWAAAHFKDVYTIEGWRPYYDANVSAHSDKKNLHMLFGDSRTQLPKVLKKVKRPALIWLDAHYLGNMEESAGTPGECPIYEELQALRACGVRHYILIDDEHLFKGDRPKLSRAQLWPSFETLYSWIPDNYYITTFEDVIIAVPQEARQTVEDYKRYPNVRIVVSTSNEYLHALPGFAHLLNQHWPEQTATVIRYDVRPPKLPGNFYNIAVGKQSELSWSAGVRSYIEKFAPHQFILMLEDYYLKSDVDAEKVKALWNYMADNPDIAKIDLTGDRMKVPHSQSFQVVGVDVVESLPDATFQTSIQAAIWRKDYFLRFATKQETPWQFEKAGTRRVIAARNAGLFDGRILGTVAPLLDYVNAIGGEGTKPGEFDRRKFPPEMWNELESKGLVR